MRYSIFILISILISGCDLFSSTKKGSIHGSFNVTTIQAVKVSQWKEGNFYYASKATGLNVSSINDVIHLLNSEMLRGAGIKAAWYGKLKYGCATTNNSEFMVIVPSKLVIQVPHKEDAKKLSHIFKPALPNPFPLCPYFIKRLDPVM